MVEVEHNRAIIWKISEPKSFEFFCWVMEPFRMITPISFRSGGQERNQVWLKMSEIEPALALLWSKISTNIHHLSIWSKRSFRWLELWVTFQLGFAEMITDFMCYDVLWCFHKLTVTSARLTNSSGLIVLKSPPWLISKHHRARVGWRFRKNIPSTPMTQLST